MGWRDDLMYLHTSGWNADDIDEACEAIHEACDEGALEGTDANDLTLAQVRSILNVGLDDRLLRSLQVVAVLRLHASRDADELRTALYDLDAFAYEFAGDD